MNIHKIKYYIHWLIDKLLLLAGKTILIIAALGLLTYGGIYLLLYYNIEKPYGTMKFDQKLWLEDKMECRGNMYKDIVKNHLRKGMSIDEVEALLGKSESISYSQEQKIKCATYILGQCLPYYLKSNKGSLQVCFNENQKVISFSNDSEVLKYKCNIYCYANERSCKCKEKDKNGYITYSECKYSPW